MPKFDKEGANAAGAVVEQHRAYFDGGFTSVNVYDAPLRAGNRIHGPSIVIQMDATTRCTTQNTLARSTSIWSILITPDKAS